MNTGLSAYFEYSAVYKLQQLLQFKDRNAEPESELHNRLKFPRHPCPLPEEKEKLGYGALAEKSYA